MNCYLPRRRRGFAVASLPLPVLISCVLQGTDVPYGTVTGGEVVVIRGANFFRNGSPDVVSLTFSGVPCEDFEAADDTTLQAVVPEAPDGPQTADLVVTTSAGASEGAEVYAWKAPPYLDGATLTPDEGSYTGGMTVTVTGASNMEPGAIGNLGDEDFPLTYIDSTSFSFVVPELPREYSGLRDLHVANPDGQEATLEDAWRYRDELLPVVAHLSRNFGPTAGGGAAITLYGGNFTGTQSVTIDGNACTSVTVVSDAELTFVPPAGTSGAKTIAVTNHLGAGSLASAYTYQAGPDLSSATFSVTTCGYQGGKEVHVQSAARIMEEATATFGGADVALRRISSTEFYFVIPAFAFDANGAKSLVVTNLDGQSGTRSNIITITQEAAPRYTDGATMDAAVKVGQVVEFVGASTGARVALLECGQLSPVKYYNAGGVIDLDQASSSQFTGVVAFAALGTGAVPDWSDSTPGNANTGGPKFSSTTGTFVLNGFMPINAIRRPNVRCAGYMHTRYSTATNDFIGVGLNSAADATKVCIAGIGKTASGHANGALTDAAVNSFTPSFNSNYANPPDESERWDLACTLHPYNGAPPAGVQTTGGANNDGQGALDGSSNVASSVHAVAADLRPAFYSKNPGRFHINKIFFVNR